VTLPTASSDNYIEAYKRMRRGILYIFIALIVSAVSFALLVVIATPVRVVPVFERPRTHPFEPREWVTGDQRLLENIIALVLIVIAVLVPLLILLVGLWGNFVPGVRRLGELNLEFRAASTLVNLGLLWGVLLVIIGLLTLVILVGFFILIVGLILVFIGYIGLIILGFKLYDFEKNGLYLAAAIIFVLGIIVPFVIPALALIVSIVGWILLYMALGDSIRRHEALTQTQPSVPTTPV